jgi:hypothetical protein
MRRMLLALIGLGLALAVSAPAAVARPLTADARAVTATTFVVSGRGWGHGVGMSQYGALGYAKDGWTYDQILGHFYTGAELGPHRRPRARARRRGEGRRDRPLDGAVPGARRLRARPIRSRPASVRSGRSCACRVNGTPTELAGPILFLPGSAPLELDRAYRGQIAVGVTGQKLTRSTSSDSSNTLPASSLRRCRAPGP